MTHFVLPSPAAIGDALSQGSAHLRHAGIGSGNLEAALLLSMATGLDRLQLINHISRELSLDEQTTYMGLIGRRATREPFQYITGEVEFMGLRFEVSPAVLVPRPDTEILVETVLDAEEAEGAREDVLIADVGTGSGAIAVSLASYLRYAQLLAVEISPEAAAIARRNAARHEVADRLEILEGDGLSPLAPYAGKLSYLVSNPPYIAESELAGLDPEVRDHEPRLALTPGEDPYVWYRRFAVDGAELLRPGGMLAVEVGIHQAQVVEDILDASGFWTELESWPDLGGIARVVTARRIA